MRLPHLELMANEPCTCGHPLGDHIAAQPWPCKLCTACPGFKKPKYKIAREKVYLQSKLAGSIEKQRNGYWKIIRKGIKFPTEYVYRVDAISAVSGASPVAYENKSGKVCPICGETYAHACLGKLKP